MKIEPLVESTDPLVNLFGCTPQDLLLIIETYRSRKLAEEIDLLESEGGLSLLEEKLKTSLKLGLSNKEDQGDRKALFGTNKPPSAESASYISICYEVLKDPILRILVVSGLISLIIGATLDEHPSYGWIEGFAIIVAVAVVVNVTAVNDYRTEKKLKQLRKQNRSGRLVTVLRDGVWASVNPKILLVGDIIKIENGLTIPADGVLIEGANVEIVEAAMTGENDNVKKLPYLEALRNKQDFCSKNPDLTETIDREDLHHEVPSPVILSGTNLAEGIGVMIVIAVGKNSAEGRILDLTEKNEGFTPLQLKLFYVANTIGKIGLICAIVTVLALYFRFIIEVSVNQNWSNSDILLLVQYFIIGITVLVVAIPEGLPLAVIISLSYSMGKMQKQNNLVRKMQACETMGGADQICSDKTGTLTQNLMTVSEIWIDDSQLNVENNPPSQRNFEPKYLHILKESIFNNSSAFIDQVKGNQGSKTEIALILFMQQLGHSDFVETRKAYQERFQRVFPFSSKRKRSSIVITTEDQKLRIHVKGASEVVSGRCTGYLTNEGTVKKMDKATTQKISQAITAMTENALRVVALAYKDLPIQIDLEKIDKDGFPDIENTDLTLIALIGIRDPIRPEVPEAVRICQQAGITVRMVTGDNKSTATAIARECKILNKDSHIVMEGKDFAALTGGTICSVCKTKICECPRNAKDSHLLKKPVRVDVVANLEAFKEVIPNLVVLARSAPDDKYTLVTGLKEIGHVVAVTGDGTNDAPALNKADIGFAMGITGTEMAKEAAGIILLDDDFNSIITAIMWGRNIYDNIRSFIQFQMTVNIVAVVCAMVGAIIIQQPALTSVQLLWVNLIMDSFASLALATDPPTEAHLKRKPYKKTDPIIEPIMWKHIILQSTLQITLILIMVFAGENFLPEFGSGTRIKYNGNTEYVISGRLYRPDGTVDYKDFDSDPQVGPSRHFTYIFNVFVLLQLTNEFNARKLRDEINVFEGVLRNKMFVGIWFFTFFIQVLIVEVGSFAFECHVEGLTVEQWFVCVAFSLVSLVFRFLFLAIPNWLFPKENKIHEEMAPPKILSIRGDSIERSKRSMVLV